MTQTLKEVGNTLTAYALFTMDGLDGIEYRQAAARKELKDLKAMGCDEAKCLTITAVGTMIDEVTDMLNEMCRDKGTVVTAGMIKKTLAAFAGVTIKVGA